VQDQQLTCKDCGAPFTFTVGEQEFYQSRGFTNQPTRCPQCRAKKKTEMRGGGGNDRHHSGPRPSFEITCSECGKMDTVPFEPREGRPVLCRDCFQKQKQSDRPESFSNRE